PPSLVSTGLCSFESDDRSYNVHHYRCRGGAVALGHTVSSLSPHFCSGVCEKAVCIPGVTQSRDDRKCSCRNTDSFHRRDRTRMAVDPGQSRLLLCCHNDVSWATG